MPSEISFLSMLINHLYTFYQVFPGHILSTFFYFVECDFSKLNNYIFQIRLFHHFSTDSK